MLRNPEPFGKRDLRLKTLWLWHSAEESEHKSTAFNLYKALGGNDQWSVPDRGGARPAGVAGTWATRTPRHAAPRCWARHR